MTDRRIVSYFEDLIPYFYHKNIDPNLGQTIQPFIDLNFKE